MIGRTILAIALLTGPVQAGELVNSEAVGACLSQNEDRAHCDQTILAPCRHMARAGLHRFCLARLRQRWERLAAQGGQPGTPAPSAQIRDACDLSLRGQGQIDQATYHIHRNACRVIGTAQWWFGNAGRSD